MHEYTFEIINDITPSGKHVKLTTELPIKTSYSTASCGMPLTVGETYLLAGWMDAKTHQPRLAMCNSKAMKWPFHGKESNDQLAHHHKQCEEYLKTNPVNHAV